MIKRTIWAWRQAIRNSDLAPLAKLCCYVLADYMRDAEKGCFPSVVTLMKDTGLSNTSIARHIRAAIDAGLLERQRFRDRAGHCAGTNYFPCFPDGVETEKREAAGPETLGAETFFATSEPACLQHEKPAAFPPNTTHQMDARPSPWSHVPLPESLNEPGVPHEIEPTPALTPLTNKSLLEGSNRKLQQRDVSEVRFGKAGGPAKTSLAGGTDRHGRETHGEGQDETEIAFLAWVDTAHRLSVPGYASRLTVSRRALLQRTLAQAGGLEAWHVILERLARARFLLGQGKRGFWISFEALCSENIRIRLLEGAYDHIPAAPSPSLGMTATQVPPARRRERIRIWKEAGSLSETWPASWGPPPSALGCLVPEECLTSRLQ